MVKTEFVGLNKINKKMYRDAINHFVLSTVGFMRFHEFSNYLVTVEIAGGPDDNPETYTDLVHGALIDQFIPHGVTIPNHSTVFIDDISGNVALEMNMLAICHEIAHDILYHFYQDSPYVGPPFLYNGQNVSGGFLWVNGVHSRVGTLIEFTSLAFGFFSGIRFVKFYGIDIHDELPK